jgi:hypothetical protein
MSRHIENGNVNPAFAEWIVALAAGTRAVVTEATIRVYAQALGDMTIAQLQTAGGRCIREKDFFPSVAELRRQIESSVDDAALIAWSSLPRAAAQVGAYTDIVFVDPVAGEAVKTVFGSWAAVCEIAGEGPAWAHKRSEFLAAYRVIRQRSTRLSAPVRLPGLCQNSEPVPADALVLVGYVSPTGQIAVAERRPQLGPGGDVRALSIHTDSETGTSKADEGSPEAPGGRRQEGGSS